MVMDGDSAEPVASVVVPTCDRREKTRKCVESLLAQTAREIEVIVVDDGSRDGTPQELEKINDSRLVVLQNEQNQGANASRNRGVQHASADLVIFLDSDCVAEPDLVEKYLPVFADASIGAASGLVADLPPANVWELMFNGTHRFGTRGPISRVCSANLCVRRKLLVSHEWEEDFTDNAVDEDGVVDTSFSGRCDEEGLYLAIRAAGWRVVAEPAAKVVHDHPYDRRALLLQAYHGGAAAAELVWKFRLRDRLDLIPLACFYLSIVPAVTLGAVFTWWWLLVPVFFLALQCAAVFYNETSRKGKTLLQFARITPVLIIYYNLRLAGYVKRRLGLLLGIEPINRIGRGMIGQGMPTPPGRMATRS